MNFLKKLYLDKFYFIASLLIGMTTILYALLINNLNLWTDEIYSVLLAKDNWHDFFTLLTTEDSKPPLYYLYLKMWLVIFPEKYEIFGAHFASYILLIVAQIFIVTEVRKDYGDKFSLWLIALTAIMPHSLWLAFEVRTYMLSNLLMLMALIYALRIVNQKTGYVKLAICTLLALYTHYYCAIWLAVLYAFMFINLLKNHDKTELKKFFLLGGLEIIAFLPWLWVPLQTAKAISKVWYVNWDYVKLSPMFFYDPLAPDLLQSIIYPFTFIFTASFTFINLIGCFNFYKPKNNGEKLFIWAIGTFFITYFILIGLSFLVRPLVTARYLKIFSLIWYVGGAVVLAQTQMLRNAFIFVALIGFPLTYLDVRGVFFDSGYFYIQKDIRTFVPSNKGLVVLDNANLFAEYYLPEYNFALVTGSKGEILRLPQAKKQFELFEKNNKEDIVLVLSMYTKMSNSIACHFAPSSYRFSKNGLYMCYIEKAKLEKLFNESRKRLFHKS